MVGSGNAKFLTLTFNDSFFDRGTSEDTRRKYIRRFLKEQCQEYVANVDYGDKNGREHFHAIVVPKSTRIDYTPYCDFLTVLGYIARISWLVRKARGLCLSISTS